MAGVQWGLHQDMVQLTVLQAWGTTNAGHSSFPEPCECGRWASGHAGRAWTLADGPGAQHKPPSTPTQTSCSQSRQLAHHGSIPLDWSSYSAHCPTGLVQLQCPAACAGWQVIKERLQQRGGLQPFHNAVLRLSCTDETSVVPAMSRVASGFLNKVTLGSYPVGHRARPAC